MTLHVGARRHPTRIPAERPVRRLEVEPHRPRPARAAASSSNYNNGDWTLERARTDLGDLARRHLALGQQLHRQLRRPLGQRLERRVHARHHPELDPDRQRLVGGGDRHPGDGAGRLRLPQRHPRQPRTSRRAPGFTWNVGGTNDFVIRGGSGPLLRAAADAVHLQPAAVQPHDHRVVHQRRQAGLHRAIRRAASPPTTRRSPPRRRRRRASSIRTSRTPYTWQSSIGFQKQLNSVTGMEVDLVHYNLYRDLRTVDPNLLYDAGHRLQPQPGDGAAEPGLRGQIVLLRQHRPARTTPRSRPRSTAG